MAKALTKSRVLLFTGNGKGKSTAALGMVLRAAGHAMRALVVQFIKADGRTGEIAALQQLTDVEIVQTGRGFVPPADDSAFAEHRATAREGLVRAAEAIHSGVYQLVVLDEVCVAIAMGLLAEADVIKAMTVASPDMIIVLTGRGATTGLIEVADTVTEMCCVKHGCGSGHSAQKGVEL